MSEINIKKMMVTPLDTISTTIAVGISLLMFIAIIIVFVYMRLQNRFLWVQLLVGLSALQNLAASVMFLFQLLQNDEKYQSQRQSFVAVMTSLGASMFYFSNNLVYWLYSFKQWAISIQVP
jgi:4-hydroxybenzoate polyprenyltransferase